jgi:Rhodopirellula transposase DDE domain
MALEALVAPETAGDPQSTQKWVRSSLRHLSARLHAGGHPASPPTVGRLLGKLDYALHVNAKKREARATHPQRNEQFEYIAAQRAAFTRAGWPVVSVDTKKKELIGNFRNAGRSWSREADAVNVHDFPQDALGRAVPYGIYDVTRNRGTVCVGQSGDTPRFAVTAVTRWWVEEGRGAFPDTDQLLILADAGGSNGWPPRLWKQQLQEQLSDRFGLTVTVCHYPTGCSKWNPIEHRLFGPISSNWAGKPLRTWETLLSAIRGTQTRTGLLVGAHLDDQVYPTGETVSAAQMAALHLERHAVCPRWNYTIRPRHGAGAIVDTTAPRRELDS